MPRDHKKGKGCVMGDLIERHAAIDALMEILDRPNHAEFLYTDEICRALNHLPSAQSEPSQAARDIATILENEKDMRVIKKNAEAESCADTISRKAAIDALTRKMVSIPTAGEKDLMGDVNRIRAEDISVIRRLPSAQPENADCIYCHEDSDGYVKPIEKNCHAFIRFGMNGWELNMKANGWHGSAKIRFCPMCGRELGHG